MRWFILPLCISVGGRSFAAGTSAATSEISTKTSLAGFCTGNTPDSDPEQTGLCQSLAEQFNKNECLKKDIETLRKRMNGQAPLEKDGTKKTFFAGFTCSADPNKGGQNLEGLAKSNPSAFSNVFMQWIAMLIAQKSNWDVLKDEENGGKGPDGLLGLTLGGGGDTDMENEKYACACKEKVTTTSGQSGVTVEGQSPGPLDGHHTVTCGAYMIIHSMVEDNATDGGGKPGAEGEAKKPKGAARIIPELKEQDPNDKKATAAAKWRDKKMETFCKQFWKSGGEVHPWEKSELKDIGGEKLKGNARK